MTTSCHLVIRPIWLVRFRNSHLSLRQNVVVDVVVVENIAAEVVRSISSAINDALR